MPTARDVRLITDPWLFGSAFNNGWDLISEAKFSLDDFREITHIWFSHEHPDHFAPPVLKAIDPTVRANITVLFQETNDHNVLDFCDALGFKVQELRNHRWHALAPGLRVLCGKVPFYDSWLLVETRGLKILNTNDCVVDGEAIAGDIVRHTGTVDVLLTQFSYANWIGNPDDRELREESAHEKLERVKIQVSTFRPTFTVPFASFVYFSHEENRYLNDAINTIDRAHNFIRRETNTTPVVLHPGDEWDIGCDPARQNATALDAYRRDYDLAAKPFRKTSSVSLEELCRLSQAYVARIKSKNSALLMALLALPPLRHFETVTFQLTDLDRVLAFDFKRALRVVEDGSAAAQMSLSSESLAFLLKFDWGYDTLMVNGRFRTSPRDYKRAMKTFYIGPLNNTGRYLHPRTLVDRDFVLRALPKFRLSSPWEPPEDRVFRGGVENANYGVVLQENRVSQERGHHAHLHRLSGFCHRHLVRRRLPSLACAPPILRARFFLRGTVRTTRSSREKAARSPSLFHHVAHNLIQAMDWVPSHRG